MSESGTTFFVGEFTHALDPKGRLTIPSKWRISGGEKHLPRPSESRRLYYRLSTENGGSIGGEGRGSELQRYADTGSFDGAFFQGALLWLRQARSNQFERQIAGACRDQEKGCVGWELFSFCDLVGGSVCEKRVCRPKEHF